MCSGICGKLDGVSGRGSDDSSGESDHDIIDVDGCVLSEYTLISD